MDERVKLKRQQSSANVTKSNGGGGGLATEGTVCAYAVIGTILLFICISACCVWVLFLAAIIVWSQNTCEKTFNLYLPLVPTCNTTACPGGYFVGQVQLSGDCNSYSLLLQYVCPIIGEPSVPRIENVHVKNTEETIVMPEDHSPSIPFDWDGHRLATKGHSKHRQVSTFPATLKELRTNPQNHRLLLYTAQCPMGAYQSVIL